MRYSVVRALRILLAAGLAGSLLVQAVMVPLLALNLKPLPAQVRFPVVIIVLLGIVTVQITMVCVWRLLTLVRRGTVFSQAAFGYVDVVTGAVATASLLAFWLAFVLAGSGLPPEMVLLVGGAGGLITGVALVVYVLRMLLAQAVARDAEAHQLQALLDEVI
ncbi:MAG: Putative transmembrane transport protein [uncultured Propionibacteriaceae bacterium]|uniref:Transmembrane transport protein n=1 Tax=uncultured Propionibacteriaceae bacterium TaxID=257457 RepID=A0A6J4N2S3_9ACTN|nr:MAG: Putative transmembrane transport protein [uncultured Propionibacteriaceae bacterium]